MTTSSPGISFEAVAPPLAESLPRMDIAGFVGFAERGPIGTPVPVEGIERFRDVFGGPVELARDEETGRMDTSYLLPAVEAFFQNGGRRCWVVRVAHLPEVSSSPDSVRRTHFGLPGLVSAEKEPTSTDTRRPSMVRARCYGTSLEGLQVGTTLRRHLLPDPSAVKGASEDPSTQALTLTWDTDVRAPLDEDELTDGDLLFLRFAEQIYVSVELPEGDSIRNSGPLLRLETTLRTHVPDATPVSLSVNTVHLYDAEGKNLLTSSTDGEEDSEDVRVLVSEIAGDAGDEGLLLIEVEGLDEAVTSFDFTLPFDASVVDVTGVDTEGTLTSDSAEVTFKATKEGIRAFVPIASQNHNASKGGSVEVQTASAHLFERAPAPLEERDDAVDVTADVQVPPNSNFLSLDAPTLESTIRRTTEAEAPPNFLLEVNGETDVDLSTLENRVAHVRGLDGDLNGWVHLGDAARRGGDLQIDVRDHLWPVSAKEAFADLVLPPVSTAERLRFDLLVWDDRELLARIDHLGFAENHPRAWTALPTDEELFDVEGGEAVAPASGTLRADVFDPRFPLAAPDAPGRAPFLPLGMAERATPERARGRIPTTVSHSRLERERLSTFSPDLFVDQELARPNTAALREKANDTFYLGENTAEEGQRGLHSLWPVDEVTLLGLPDAYHREWTERPPTETDRIPSSVPIPSLKEPELQEGDPHQIRLSWSLSTEEKYTFELQESRDPSFSDPTVLYEGEERETIRYVRDDQTQVFFFRVRGRTDGKTGGWSVTHRVEVPEPDFVDCADPLKAPSAQCAEEGLRDDAIEFDRLKPEPEELLHYEVQAAPDPAFTLAQTIDRLEPDEGEPFRVSLRKPLPALSYGRVRAVVGPESDPTPGPWSCTVVLKRPLPKRQVLVAPHEYDRGERSEGAGRDGLLRVQRSALRFAAARGDVLVMLGLPEHDETEQVRSHVRRLTSSGTSSESYGSPLDPDEKRTLSFGALYHPWPMHAGRADSPVRPMPPGGAITGLAAVQALTQGAWFPPANVGLHGPGVLASLRGTLSDLPDRLNLLRESPRGVLTLDATTLAADSSLRPIPARRTLILVRRLAVREGPELVFQSHGPRLRRRVAEHFEGLLRRLFEQGALAGSIPAEAYRVVADDSVNPPARRERGEMVVELRVAPSRPLEFITVRLVQRNDTTRAALA